MVILKRRTKGFFSGTKSEEILEGRAWESESGKVHRLMPDLDEDRDRCPDVDKRVFSMVEPELLEDQYKPVGFELRVGQTIAVSDTFFPEVNEFDWARLDKLKIEEGREFVLEPDENGRKVYYIPTYERFSLMGNYDMLIDSRSTTGRVGCMSHHVGETIDGEKIVAVQLFAFPIIIRPGETRLFQAFLRYKGSDFLGNGELKESWKVKLVENERDVFDERLSEHGLEMTFSTDFAYKARKCDEPIDMDMRGLVDPGKYFERIEPGNESIVEPNVFYLFGTREEIILGDICGRLSRAHHKSGTGLWTDFAGFFQPGFRGEITLECYSNVRRKIRTGDSAGIVVFDDVKKGDIEHFEPTFKIYSGDYQGQKAPKLPKMFKEW
ncbi:MAG: 2'-deoxycytidine 5'-triphosphate deaminase [archaeon]